MTTLHPELVMKAAKLVAETIRILQNETETDSVVVRIEHDAVNLEIYYYCKKQLKIRWTGKSLSYANLMLVDVYQEAKTWSQMMLNPENSNA